MEHIKLTTIKRLLQERTQCDNPDKAFELMLYGYTRMKERSGLKHFRAQMSRIKQCGWMTEKQANDFLDYIIPGWNID